MSILAIAADGSRHVFPNNTPKSVIDKALLTYTRQQKVAAMQKATNAGVFPGEIYGLGTDAMRTAEMGARGVGDIAHIAGTGATAVGLPSVGNALQSFTPGQDLQNADQKLEQIYTKHFGQLPGFQTGKTLGSLGGALIGGGEVGAGLKGLETLQSLGRFAPLGKLLSKDFISQYLAPNAAAGAITAPAGSQNAVQGAKTGALFSSPFWLTSKLAGPLGRFVGPTIRHLAASFAPDAEKAKMHIYNRMVARELTPEAAAAELKALGPNALPAHMRAFKGLAKKTTSSDSLPGDEMIKKLDAIRADASHRVSKHLEKLTGQTGDTEAMTDALRLKLKSEGHLFEKALSGGGMQALQPQFEAHWSDLGRKELEAQNNIVSAKAGITLAKAKLTQTAGNVYSESAAQQELAVAENTHSIAVQKLADIAKEKADAFERMQQAQKDGSAGKRGAVWSPNINHLMRDEYVKEGMKGGIKELQSDANNKYQTLSLHDFGVTGEDAEGNPIISAVPNMLVIHAAKRGLDVLIDKAGVSGNKTLARILSTKKSQLIEEVSKINPDYKPALAAYEAPNRVIRAVELGKKALTTDSQVTAKQIAALNPEEKAGYLNGLTWAAKNVIDKPSGGPNAAKALFGSPIVQKRIEAAVGGNKKYSAFQKAMEQEMHLARTTAGLLPGGEKAVSPETDASQAAYVARSVENFSVGNPWYGIANLLKGIVPHNTDTYYSELNKHLLANHTPANFQSSLESLTDSQEHTVAGKMDKISQAAKKYGVSAKTVLPVVSRAAGALPGAAQTPLGGMSLGQFGGNGKTGGTP
jgi:hypothetical protein